MFNPYIIVAILLQGVMSKGSKTVGAVFGYILTTGILIWGLTVYAQGDQIALFGMPISQTVFIVACLVWYAFDTKEFFSARRHVDSVRAAVDSVLLQDQRVVGFYQSTLDAWGSGQLSDLNAAFQQEAKTPYEDFVKIYPPQEGGCLHVLFTQFPPQPGEFLVGVGDEAGAKNPAWFILTNQRLIQRDGKDNTFKELVLSEIDSVAMKGIWNKTLRFQLRTGETKEFQKVTIYPDKKFLKHFRPDINVT
ncbi:MAG: hypothetical protein K8S27_12085 [Candidatus Omnitrophica bacterium]|nr:hypothetical protein [Candidatus Omnitrophota bacterium]